MTGVVGEWLLPTAMLPYFVATGLQDTYLRLGLLIASALAAAHIVLLGVVLYLARQRKVFPYILEVIFVVMYPILCGIAYSSDENRDTIQKYYNFIVLSTLSGISFLSMIVTYPLGLAHVQEMVPWHLSSHEDVLRLGYQTTSLFCAATTSLCLLYIWPVARGVEDQHLHILNLIFRLILPTVVMGIVVILMQLWPRLQTQYLWNKMNDYNRDLVVKGLSPVDWAKPRVLDNAMFAAPHKPAVNPYEIPQKPPQGYQTWSSPLYTLTSSPYSSPTGTLQRPGGPSGQNGVQMGQVAAGAVYSAQPNPYGALGLNAGPGVHAAPAPLLPVQQQYAGAPAHAGPQEPGYYPAPPDGGAAYAHRLANKYAAPSAPSAAGYGLGMAAPAYSAAPPKPAMPPAGYSNAPVAATPLPALNSAASGSPTSLAGSGMFQIPAHRQ